MNINKDKTAVPVVAKNQMQSEENIENESIRQVDNFKYLGSMLNARRELESEINIKINNVYHATLHTKKGS